jgi:hypothetical protein
MTIRLLTPRGVWPANAIITLDAATETSLVADGVASFDLIGGTVYAPLDTTDRTVPMRQDSVSGAIPGVNGLAVAGAWMRPSIPLRIRIVGTGTLSMDARDAAGTVTLAVFSVSYAMAADAVEWPYPGDTARQVRFIFPPTMTVEVL